MKQPKILVTGATGRTGSAVVDELLAKDVLAAGIRRVKGVKKIGVRLGNWLTAEQSQRLWQVPGGERLKEKRDRAYTCDSTYNHCPDKEVYDPMQSCGIVRWTYYILQSNGTYKQPSHRIFNNVVAVRHRRTSPADCPKTKRLGRAGCCPARFS